jgi:DNA-directed RNA polymerase specialized sigma24 family protein
LEEKDYDEISDILQKPIGTVSALIHRARKKLEVEAGNMNLEDWL